MPDYQYERFKDGYEKRQKMINDNINKYYPKLGKEKPDVDSYYDNYVNNPNYNRDNRNEGYNTINKRNNNMYDDYNPNKDKNRLEYIKSLEDQINQKNELKRKEKEEDKRRERQQYENMQRELNKEEEEKYLKEKKQKEELIRANQDLIN